jgi:hypothetical protein
VTRDEFEGIDIRRELRAARPEPTSEFTSMLADRVRADEPRRRVAPRMALAFVMTVAGLAVAAAFGGISQAAYTVEGAVSSIVHVGHKAKPSHAPTASGATASSASKNAPGASSTASNDSHSKFGGGSSHGGSHQPPPVQLPGSPAANQYGRGCIPGFRGPYIKCDVP